MKIHIVQKGDTLWEIAKKYKVDFEELKQINSHLSSPDMIMPGMKIKIPSSTKPVKKEGQVKEKKTVKEKQAYKDTSPMPKPVIKEDDQQKPKEVKAEMPKMPEMPTMPKMPPQQPMMQMPVIEQDLSQYTTIQMPEIKKETVKQESKKEKQEVKKEAHVPYTQPVNHHPMPVMPMPICCHVINPCCPSMPMGHHHMHHQNKHHQMPMALKPSMSSSPCDCDQGYHLPNKHMSSHVKPWKHQAPATMHSHHHTAYPMPPSVQGVEQEYHANNNYPPYYATDPAHHPYPHPATAAYPSFKRDDINTNEE